MATLWIREYTRLGFGGGAQIAQEVGTDQTPVTFTTSAQSAAFAGDTVYICMYASAAFHYVVGTNPTATTNAMKVAADTNVYIGVPPGAKVAAIVAA